MSNRRNRRARWIANRLRRLVRWHWKGMQHRRDADYLRIGRLLARRGPARKRARPLTALLGGTP